MWFGALCFYCRSQTGLRCQVTTSFLFFSYTCIICHHLIASMLNEDRDIYSSALLFTYIFMSLWPSSPFPLADHLPTMGRSNSHDSTDSKTKPPVIPARRFRKPGVVTTYVVRPASNHPFTTAASLMAVLAAVYVSTPSLQMHGIIVTYIGWGFSHIDCAKPLSVDDHAAHL